MPRVEQINLRHGRIRVLWHLPLSPVPLPSVEFMPPVLHRIYPGYFRPSEASLSGDFVFTFDGRTLMLPCRTVLLAAFRHPSLGWKLMLRKGREVELQLGGRRFLFASDVSKSGTETNADVVLGRTRGRHTLEAKNRGFSLEVGRRRMTVVKLRLRSPIYFNRIEGVFGNNDGLRSNDMAVPGKPFNPAWALYKNFLCQ